MLRLRKLDKVIVCAVLVLITLLLSRVYQPMNSAQASHPSATQLHVDSMHYANFNEDMCIRMEYSSMTFNTARDRMVQTLYLDFPSGDWDDLNGGRIYFIVLTEDCAWLEQYQNATYQATELEYTIISDTTAASLCGNAPDGRIASCASSGQQLWYGSHWDYQYYYINMQGSRLNGSQATYRHVINHETGHVLGLADPGGCTGYTSVMHSTRYFCSVDLSWPTVYDRNTAISVSNLN